MRQTKSAPTRCINEINTAPKSASRAQIPAPHTAATHAIEQLRAADVQLHAWTELANTASVSQPTGSGRLHQLCFGVKDNMDVQGLHTQAGSRALAHLPAATSDALVVQRLRQAGACPVGKTVTTEFAFRDPAGTKNPYHLAHTPGGSSSGSAAAVGAGHVPFALATQTAGSLNRPAAYCGAFGIKPSYGLLPTAGLRALSPAFDTIGVISKDLSVGAEALAVMAENPALTQAQLPRDVRWATLSARFFSNSAPCVQDTHQATLANIHRQYGPVDVVDVEVDFQAVVQHHRTVMLFEAYALYQPLLHSPELLQPEFREALQIGQGIAAQTAQAAQQALAQARDRVWQALAPYDALVLQPVPSPAPHGLGSTGDQSYLTPWTAFGGPLITIPTHLSPEGLPLATMLAARPGDDAKLIALAQWLAQQVHQMPAPRFMA